MKRVFFLTFMSVYLLGSAEFSQLLRLPMIFIHYNNHLADNDKLGFVYFLTSHYDEFGDGVSSDDEEESQMPFMRSVPTASAICFVYFSKVKLKSLFFRPLERNCPNYIQSYTPELHALSLLRPPAFTC